MKELTSKEKEFTQKRGACSGFEMGFGSYVTKPFSWLKLFFLIWVFVPLARQATSRILYHHPLY